MRAAPPVRLTRYGKHGNSHQKIVGRLLNLRVSVRTHNYDMGRIWTQGNLSHLVKLIPV